MVDEISNIPAERRSRFVPATKFRFFLGLFVCRGLLKRKDTHIFASLVKIYTSSKPGFEVFEGTVVSSDVRSMSKLTVVQWSRTVAGCLRKGEWGQKKVGVSAHLI